MKKAAASLLITFIAATAQAGSFGGPPPFTNGSPLPSGVDGSYQASARGSNLAGVFRFTYANGSQTSDPELNSVGSFVDPYNDYVFFINGVVYRGPVQANINDGAIAGVLDNGGANIPSLDGSSSPGPLLLTFMSGFFNGSGDNNSPYFSFKGKGETSVWVFDTVANVWNFSDDVKFKFTGVRNAVTSSSSSQ